MPGSSSRQPLITAVAIKRPLTPGFRVLLTLVVLLAVAAGIMAWHSERMHRKARHNVRALDTQLAQDELRLKSLQDSLAALQQSQQMQQEALDRLLAAGPQVRQRWLVDRVSDLVAVAEQALALNRQVVIARQNLTMADRLLADNPLPALLPLRRAIQQDLRRLAQLPTPDVDGIYLRLQTLDRRLQALDLPRDAGQRAAAPPRPAATSSPGDTLQALWAAGIANLRELIVIRHYDQPLQPLLDEARRQLMREQYSLVVDQAELALLRADGTLYRAALESLSLRLQRELSALPHARLAPILDDLAALQAEQVGVPVPDSLTARAELDALMPVGGSSL